MLNGFSRRSRKYIADRFKIKNPQHVHCYLSLTIILFGIIHAVLLVSGPYTLDATPNLYGITAVILFGSIVVSGFYRERIILEMGIKKWKWVHRLLSISVILIITYHTLTFGSHFN